MVNDDTFKVCPNKLKLVFNGGTIIQKLQYPKYRHTNSSLSQLSIFSVEIWYPIHYMVSFILCWHITFFTLFGYVTTLKLFEYIVTFFAFQMLQTL